MATKHGLGRGLAALLKDGAVPETTGETAAGVRTVSLQDIQLNPRQPRRAFHEQALAELADSVRSKGVLQPLLVRPAPSGGYELIAGERRLRAATEAGLAEVPVIVMEVADRDALELALVENLQREDLNVVEEAEGYRMLAEQFELTHEQIAERMGKARASVTNTLRILSLPDAVKDLVANGTLSEGHAKLLTGIDIADEQILFAQRTVREGLSVRNLEKLIQKARRAPRKRRAARTDIPATHVSHLLDVLHRHFGTNVRITPSRTLANGKKAKGCLEVDFYSSEDLDRILTILGIAGD